MELRIASELKTSQAPVREALRELEAIGLVESRPNRGARVRVLSTAETREIYDIRAQLEGYASACATKKGIDLTAKLDAQIAGMRRAAGASDSMRFSEHNTRFHRIILEAAGNATLLTIWEGLNVRARTSVNVIRHEVDLLAITESHRILVETVASGDPVAARDAAEAHVLANRP